jgi:hypothetical protein
MKNLLTFIAAAEMATGGAVLVLSSVVVHLLLGAQTLSHRPSAPDHGRLAGRASR